jgi:glycosyltransferase involved in cell wall biosynthesis
MRIGVMLRAFGESGGIAVYSRNLVEELLKIDQRNSYVFYYRDSRDAGGFRAHPNVEERVVGAPNKAVWDQIAIPYWCWRDGLDVIFHPKFTVPLLAPCKTAMVVHGADWFMPDQAVYYGYWDVRYIRAIMPLYFKKSAVVVSVSRLTTENFHSVLDLPKDKIKTVYFGPASQFHPVCDPSRLQQVKAKYGLPDRFILTLTKRGGDERKNFGQLLKAYRHHHGAAAAPHKLVVGGKDCHLFRAEYGIPEDGYGQDIIFPGWIDQNDLPAVYTLADLFFYPSNLEAFPIPLTEAMACGTPIVTSDVNGLREVAGDAACFVDPRNDREMAETLTAVLSDKSYLGVLAAKGLARAGQFRWDQCAKETLAILESLKTAR